MVYRVPCPPSGAPAPKLRRFRPQRTLAPLLNTLLVMQAFTTVAMLIGFIGIVNIRWATTPRYGCGCFWTLSCMVY